MNGFEIEFWHVLVFFFTVLLGIFKTDISALAQSLILIWHKAGTEGQKIEIPDPAGVWKEVTIIRFVVANPFRKTGSPGVVLEHKEGEETYQEVLSFSNWNAIRKRKPCQQ